MTTLTDALTHHLFAAWAHGLIKFVREANEHTVAAFIGNMVRAEGFVIFESREALTAALAEALETVYWPDEQAGAERDFAAAIVAHLLPEADHATD